MKILFITPEWPYPLDQGGRIRMFYLLQQLARHHEVHLLSVVFQPVLPPHQHALAPFCRTTHTILHSQSRWRGAGRLVKSWLMRQPYLIHKYAPSTLPRQLFNLVTQVKPDCLFINTQYLALAARGIRLPVLVDFHDVASLLYTRFAQNGRWDMKKVHSRLQLPHITRFERLLPAQFSLCTTTSVEDATHLQQLSGGKNVVVLPNGVDVTYFQPQSVAGVGDLIYVGSMDYYPNVDAVLFLAAEVLPLIWQKRPNTTLTIVGRNPTQSVQRLAQNNRIFVTGGVADVRPYLQQAAVVLLPLRIGGGTRLKVLEAAAMGKAIVGTPVGLEGLGLTNGRHALFATTPAALAQATLQLLQSPPQRQQLETAARLWAEQFSWHVMGQRLEAVLACLMAVGPC